MRLFELRVDNTSVENAVNRIRDGYFHGFGSIGRTTCYTWVGDFLRINRDELLAHDAVIALYGPSKTSVYHAAIRIGDLLWDVNRQGYPVSENDYVLVREIPVDEFLGEEYLGG